MATLNDAAGENMSEHISKVETDVPKNKMENDKTHLDPSRWWFASSAFPMIAGTLGPVASAFSICALVRPWRQDIRGSAIGATPPPPFIKDPPWLLIVNGLQLVVALISNIFLLLNMARRVRFSVAQPITIVGWYISSICLMVLNATAAGPLLVHPTEHFVWSQAFWYGMWAAILYFVIASLMIVTVCGAHTGHYSKDFQLTNSQRTLMLQTIMLLLYMLIGALIFSTIEGWQYLDAIYWADVTLFTVGFGDFSASTRLGRGLLLPYALVGIISLGLVIGSIRSMVLERGRRKLDARMVEKKRRKMVTALTIKGDDHILKPIRGEEDPGLMANIPEEKLRRAEFERRRAEFNLMRHIQHKAGVRRQWVAMAVSTGTWIVLWMVGAKIFIEFERPYQDWTYFEGFYFVFVTLTTIGYGDRVPKSNGGRSFFVFWSLLALPTMTVLISNAGDTVVKVIRDSTLSLGNITILPGERGFKTDFHRIMRRLSFRIRFRNRMENTVPGFHGTTETLEGRQSRNEDKAAVVGSPQPPMANVASTGTDEENRPQMSATSIRNSISLVRDPRKPLPDDATEYHYILISEIAAVTQDLKSSKPVHYTFNDWAWFLKLIGEDESSPETHRKARPRKHGPGKNWKGRRELSRSRLYRRTFTERLEEEGEKWSWVGAQSPLMGSIEESEWILERLTQRLREELAAARRQEMQQEEGTAYEDLEEDEVDDGDDQGDEIEPKKT